MNRLRTFGTIALAAILLVAIAGTICVFYQQWVWATIFGYAALLLTVLSIFMAARYISVHARTGERNAKVTSQQLAVRIKQAMRKEERSGQQLQTLIESTRANIRDSATTAARSFEAIYHKIEEVDDRVGTLEDTVQAFDTHIQATSNSHARSLGRNIRDHTRESTRQIEAMLQLYPRYPQTKIPMPPSGGWAIDAQALGHMLTLVEERRPQRILELGSGTSTVWLGYACASYGGKLVSLDHLENYLAQTEQAIQRHELHANVECRLAPLEQTSAHGETYDWYSTQAFADLENIDMVIVDGPPGSTGPQARYPALPKVIDQLAPHATIILDDAHRKDEADIIDGWLEAFPEFQQVEHGTSRLAVIERLKHA